MARIVKMLAILGALAAGAVGISFAAAVHPVVEGIAMN